MHVCNFFFEKLISHTMHHTVLTACSFLSISRWSLFLPQLPLSLFEFFPFAMLLLLEILNWIEIASLGGLAAALPLNFSELWCFFSFNMTYWQITFSTVYMFCLPISYGIIGIWYFPVSFNSFQGLFILSIKVVFIFNKYIWLI